MTELMNKRTIPSSLTEVLSRITKHRVCVVSVGCIECGCRCTPQFYIYVLGVTEETAYEVMSQMTKDLSYAEDDTTHWGNWLVMTMHVGEATAYTESKYHNDPYASWIEPCPLSK